MYKKPPNTGIIPNIGIMGIIERLSKESVENLNK
tara:strand:+ start:954 stop:1055 length:102 start_codon:yes stop_codon:yes gene_type:complete